MGDFGSLCQPGLPYRVIVGMKWREENHELSEALENSTLELPRASNLEEFLGRIV